MLQLPIYQPQAGSGQFSVLELLSFLINLRPELAWIFVALVCAVYGIVSFVLYYHWKKFGFEKDVMRRAAVIYFLFSSVLIAVMAVSVLIYLNSL